jgi:hypothetical protein
VIYIRLARIAAVLGFVAFIVACVIPAESAPPISPYPQGQYPQQTGGPGMMAGGPIEAGCSYNGTQLPGDVGASFQIACPPGCEATGGLWGTDVYTADSAICRAGIHAGVISPGGGVMSVQLEPGRPAYRGSMRNGIASNDYGSYGKSYVVVAGGAPAPGPQGPPGYAPYQPPQASAAGYPPGYPPAPPQGPPGNGQPQGYPPPPPGYGPQSGGQVIEAGCSYNATQIEDQLGTRHVVACPPGCANTGGLWGTDVYTADSGICRAASHAGFIGPQGGVVAVILEPGRPAYRGMVRNGIQSNDYGAYGKSFRLERP